MVAGILSDAGLGELTMCEELSKNYREILVGLGENPEREGLVDTPKRAAKAMQYLCNGYEIGRAHV